MLFASRISRRQILRFWVDDVLCNIQDRHPNVPRERFSRPGRCDAVVEPLPPALCEWRCSECQQGIRKGPRSTKAARYVVALRHLQACWGPQKTIKQNRARLAKETHKKGDPEGTSNLSKRKVVKQLSAEMSETSPEAHKIQSFVHPRDAAPKSWSCWACETCAKTWNFHHKSLCQRCLGQQRRGYNLARRQKWWKLLKRKFAHRISSFAQGLAMTQEEIQNMDCKKRPKPKPRRPFTKRNARKP